MTTSDDLIRISVSIEIPLSAQLGSGQQPKVSVSAPMRPLIANEISITYPAPYPGGLARLKIGNGTICVSGTSNNDADYVWVNIYTWPSYAPPEDPSSVTTKQPATIDSSGNWILTDVPCSPNTSYQVAAWGQWGSSYLLTYWRFMTDGGGLYTDCEIPSGMLLRSQQASRAAFDLMPVAWQLKTTGFTGPDVVHLNGGWTLRLVNSGGQKVLYCNGGDGASVPRIQLACQSPLAATWDLSFELGGKRVSYSRSAAQFDAQARNAFQSAQTSGLGGEVSIPAMISVQPA